MGCFSPGSQTTTSKVELPAWLEDQAQENIYRAEGIADQPYEAFGGERVAGFSGDQTSAFDAIRQFLPEATSGNNYSEIAASGAATPIQQTSTPKFTEIDINEYINPYTDAVLGDTLSALDESAGRDRQRLASQATSAGAFGDARHGVESAGLTENLLDTKSDITNRILSQAFDKGAGLFQGDVQNQLATFGANVGAQEQGLSRLFSGLESASNLDTAELGQLLNYSGALSAVGGQEQALEQRGLDIAHQDFLDEKNYPIEMLNLLNATTSLQPHGQTTTQTQPTASPFAQGLGGLLSLGSFFI